MGSVGSVGSVGRSSVESRRDSEVRGSEAGEGDGGGEQSFDWDAEGSPLERGSSIVEGGPQQGSEASFDWDAEGSPLERGSSAAA